MTEVAIVFATLGGLAELVGVGVIAKGIRDDRRQASELLEPERAGKHPPRKYPRKPRPSSLPDYRLERQQHAVSRRFSQLEAQIGGALIDLRRAVDEDLDDLHDALVDDIDEGDRELRDGLRTILAGSVADRTFGVLALVCGIALATAGSVLGALS